MISILTATYKRPDVLRQCLENGIKKAGTVNFEWLIWDNGQDQRIKELVNTLPFCKYFSSPNIGLNAYSKLAEMAEGELFVTLDDDVIDFSENWLITLKNCFYNAPFPYQCWGWLGSDTIRDDKTNGALWPDWVEGTRILQGPKGDKFMIDKRVPQTCTMTHKELYRRVGGFKTSKQKFFGLDSDYAKKIDQAKFPQGVCLQVQVYHACGPYFYQDYPELWLEKQGETIKESAKTYLKRDPSLTAYKNL